MGWLLSELIVWVTERVVCGWRVVDMRECVLACWELGWWSLRGVKVGLSVSACVSACVEAGWEVGKWCISAWV